MMEEPGPKRGEGGREGGRESILSSPSSSSFAEEGQPLREVESSNPPKEGGGREGGREGVVGGGEVGEGGEEGGEDLPFLPPVLALYPFLGFQDVG